MYEKMLSELIKNDTDICVCQWQYEYNDGKRVIDKRNIDDRIYGKKSSIEFAEFFYRGQYECCTVGVLWNKLYSKAVFEGIKFWGNCYEDERIQNEILSRDCALMVIPEQMYVYCQNQDSLTNKPFGEKNLLFLDVLAERLDCFSDNKYILSNTKKLYCNMYIEYYYKTKIIGIKMRDITLFDQIFKRLLWESDISIRFF